MRIAAVQTIPRFGEVEANLAAARALALSQEARLYVLPEVFATGYLFRDRAEAAAFAEEYPDGRVGRFLARLSREAAAVIAAGFVERAADGGVYNAGALFDRGKPLACYRKIQLFDRERLWCDPGDRPPRAHASSAGVLGPLICFDWIYPEITRCLALAGAQILVHMTNLVLPFCQDAMVTRCIENRVFAVTANRAGLETRDGMELRFTGRSQITGPDGARLAQASSDREEVIVADIDPLRADDKRLNARNDLLRDRRPGLYGRLVE